MSGSVDELVAHRLARANESLEEAVVMADTGHWNTCVNRLYYACFYSVSALLARNNLESAKHAGVRSFFNLHFVKTEKVSRDLAGVYNNLFERRQECDYEDFFECTPDDVRPWIEETRVFLKAVNCLARI